MSTSYDKVVKLACKPKAAPPKPKYLDPIIAATWSEDGAVHDVCKALAPRFREPNAIVVFKALIVLHTMIRNGATDNVLAYLSSSDVLRLKNISSTAHWEGYAAPQNMQNYAVYLDTRIRAYRDLKHDAIRVQSESNRDMRNSAAIEEDRQVEQHERKRFGRRKARDSDEGTHASSGPQRSKTIAGRKLRVMTVEKGLLRETKVVQKMIDSLVECRFYLDDLEDELNITSLRMLVKDLLILFQACNEGVINVLEHYFEMSKIDAKEALNIYRRFCEQTERVVEYLGVAKKLQNLLSVPIPNLRHAPVSLAGALEEYLNDPNFEQNRIEYKTAKEIADRNARNGVKPAAKPAEKPVESKPATTSSAGTSSAPPKTENMANNSQAMIDFFSAIESEQTQMFNPQTNSPTSNYFQQQAAYNPFQQQQMAAGQPFAVPQIQQPVQVQPTGFMVPQATGANPFSQHQAQQAFGGFLQAQPTGFLVPQATGANPFRQSMLMPQSTGMPGPFGFQQHQQPPQQQQQQPQVPFQTGSPNPFPQGNAFGGQSPSTNPFPAPGQQPQPTGTNSFPGLQSQSSNPFPNFSTSLSLGGQPPASQPNLASTSNPFPSFNQPSFASPSAQPASNAQASNAPPRSASVPLGGNPPEPTPVKTHQTGSRNPFGQPVAPAPPVPKVPTLMELAMGRTQGNTQQPQTNGTTSPTSLQPQATGYNPSQNSSLISSIASSFATGNATQESSNSSNPLGISSFSSFSPNTTSPTATGSTTSNSLFSSFTSQPTGATSSTSPALQPQTTGFSGIKPFKPSSSFGAALLESLPPIPQSTPTTPDPNQQPPRHNPTGSLGSSSLLNAQPTGFSSGLDLGTKSTVGVGLRPQATGLAGQANPFRSTMFSLSPGPTGNAFGGLGSTPTGLPSQPTGLQTQFGSNNNLFGGSFGLSPSSGTPNTQQQQNGQPTSLI